MIVERRVLEDIPINANATASTNLKNPKGSQLRQSKKLRVSALSQCSLRPTMCGFENKCTGNVFFQAARVHLFTLQTIPPWTPKSFHVWLRYQPEISVLAICFSKLSKYTYFRKCNFHRMVFCGIAKTDDDKILGVPF